MLFTLVLFRNTVGKSYRTEEDEEEQTTNAAPDGGAVDVSFIE